MIAEVSFMHPRVPTAPRHPAGHRHPAGFTLIELSIVLVILGLLVAGVVIGKEMVLAARVQAVIKDISRFRASVNTFQSKYDALPGDFKDAYGYWGKGVDTICGSNDITTFGCNGNGDGIIGHSGSSEDYMEMSEPARVWIHLQLAQILFDVSYPCCAGWSSGTVSIRSEYAQEIVTVNNSYDPSVDPRPTVPTSNIAAGAGYSIINPAQDTGDWVDGPYPRTFYKQTGAWIMLSIPGGGGEFFGVGTCVPCQFGDGAPLTPDLAAQIDRKLDDGLPTSGKVIATQYWHDDPTCIQPGFGWDLAPWMMDNITPSQSITYNFPVTSKACVLLFHLGGG